MIRLTKTEYATHGRAPEKLSKRIRSDVWVNPDALCLVEKAPPSQIEGAGGEVLTKIVVSTGRFENIIFVSEWPDEIMRRISISRASRTRA